METKVLQKDFIVNIRYAKSCDYFFSYTGYLNEKDIHVFYDNNVFKKIKESKQEILSVYCKTDYLNNFFKKIDKNKKIILVTGCSDTSITKRMFDRKPPNIIKWYAENVDYLHNDLIPTPLGSISGTWIGNSVKEAEAFRHSKFSLFNPSEKNPQIKNLIFMCFSIHTNESYRRPVYNYFNDKPWVTNLCKEKTGKYLEDSEFLNNVYNHHFTISPFGAGLDCGRTWATLQSGRIPIIPYHFSFEDFCRNLPIIMYKDINEITEEYLLNKLDEFKKINYTYDYLKTSYWKNKFKNI